ncbi:50S ribosomal protein L21e [Halobacterium litoreum]|uniref:Large ribosomal subunit protein eL21 n=1 Tax=Halobacterium litoreum TaxID=2039234 RepID=A0ABD5NC37_9EURY|nr:50S ribosomal protein L21e [Halobacterium litoreum]UHH14270.1 50S ribosomal protein L21e [Halobacterium litoreum]
MPSSNGPLNSTREKLSNKPRERGTSPPQRAVTEFEEGQKVHLKIDPSVNDGRFHARFSGHTGTVVGKQGAAFKVQVNDGGKDKIVIANAAHLRAQEE